MRKVFKVLNSQGQPIVLNEYEQRIADINQRQVNALGLDIDITTMTQVLAKVSEQKFFEIAPADYTPIRVGEGAWSTTLTTYRSYNIADDFSTGIVDTGANNGRLASASAGVDPISIKTIKWAKTIGWNLMEMAEAARAGNWDMVAALEKSRKTNWDLGIQKVAFLGLADGTAKGLLNQAGITSNTTLITEPISTMTGLELKAFCAGVLKAYRINAVRTAWPTHFVIPEDDFLGLASTASPDFPIRSTLSVLEETFQTMTGNKSFKILPCAYADAAGVPGVAKRYSLYNYNEDSLRMDIPVDYTSTVANSVDNFSFQNVAYGQFTGVLAYRPLEMLYFDY